MATGDLPVHGERWLLLIHQLPAKPAYQRVKVWRRLQSLGAVAVKNAVHALPLSAEAVEDFGWLMREITAGGGEAVICEARLVDGLTDSEMRALFNRARDADYAELAAEVRALAATLDSEDADMAALDVRAQLPRLKSRLAQIEAIDHFGAEERQTVLGMLGALEARLDTNPSQSHPAQACDLGALGNRTWVTRAGVFVDRIASAWLIRRFIDPGARFRFVNADDPRHTPGELRFDMAVGEFTHEGDRCTFEVLLERTGLDEPALRTLAEIVHDIDLKDGKFGRPEAAGIRTMIAAICTATPDDTERLARGATLLDDLYGHFRRSPA